MIGKYVFSKGDLATNHYPFKGEINEWILAIQTWKISSQNGGSTSQNGGFTIINGWYIYI
jgi:hypothetical protein